MNSYKLGTVHICKVKDLLTDEQCHSMSCGNKVTELLLKELRGTTVHALTGDVDAKYWHIILNNFNGSESRVIVPMTAFDSIVEFHGKKNAYRLIFKYTANEGYFGDDDYVTKEKDIYFESEYTGKALNDEINEKMKDYHGSLINLINLGEV